MALRTRRGGHSNGLDAWPGYVDALSTLLMVVMFVLLVFVLAQAFQSVVLVGRNEDLSATKRTLSDEQRRAQGLSGAVARLNQDVAAGEMARTALEARIRDLNAQTARTMVEKDNLSALLREMEMAAAAAATLNQTLTARVEVADRDKARLTTDLLGQSRRADDATRRGEDLTTTFAARGAELDRTRAAAERDKATLTARLGEQTSRAETATRDNQTLTADLATRTAEIEKMRGAATAADKDKAALTARLGEQTTRAETAARDSQTLTAALAARAAEIEQMRREAAAAETRLAGMKEQLAAYDRTVRADKAAIEVKLSDLARLTEQITIMTALRDRMDQQARAAGTRLDEEKKRGDGAEARLARLTQQAGQLRATLDASERERESEKSRAAGLTLQLNLALAAQVEELRKYRSDFFGKLRAVMADKPGVSVVGDRFVFQSEVLFSVSSDQLTPAGGTQMADLAASFRKITDEIPPDVNWVLRVDGHTDSVPVSNVRFRSNWELSAARAITVVKFLITQGISARHLAATGFGENQPVDAEDTPEAHAKNRRIEIRLTDR